MSKVYVVTAIDSRRVICHQSVWVDLGAAMAEKNLLDYEGHRMYMRECKVITPDAEEDKKCPSEKKPQIHFAWAGTPYATNKMTENMDYLALLLKRIGGKGTYTLSKTTGQSNVSYELTPKTVAAAEMTPEEAALLADEGNLCFGGRQIKYERGVFTGVIYTD